MPVAVTTPTTVPLAMAVPLKSMFSLACSSQSLSGTGSETLDTATDSPANGQGRKRPGRVSHGLQERPHARLRHE